MGQIRAIGLFLLLAGSAAAAGTAEKRVDFDGGGVLPQVGSTGEVRSRRAAKPEDRAGDVASPTYRALPNPKGVNVYSKLANPEAEDQEDIPGEGSLRLGTQLRTGEDVQVVRENGDWVFVNVPGQNYSGWVRKSELSRDEDGSLAAQFPAQGSPAGGEQSTPQREAFVKESATWDGTPYKWGGMTKKVGVDCSGLVKGAMDKTGMGAKVPRTADEQHKAAKKVSSGRDLAPGDLIFTSKKGEGKISHVIIYVGGGNIREAMKSGTSVSQKSFQQRFGVSVESVSSEGKAGSHKVYFGTFF